MTELGELVTLQGVRCRVVDRFPIKDSDGNVIAYGLECKPIEQPDAEA